LIEGQSVHVADVLADPEYAPGELQPVFQAMLENAARTCDANFGTLLLYEDGAYRMAAMHGAPPSWVAMVVDQETVRK
jgi:two-component system, NtrC family, sensor kinase